MPLDPHPSPLLMRRPPRGLAWDGAWAGWVDGPYRPFLPIFPRAPLPSSPNDPPSLSIPAASGPGAASRSKTIKMGPFLQRFPLGISRLLFCRFSGGFCAWFFFFPDVIFLFFQFRFFFVFFLVCLFASLFFFFFYLFFFFFSDISDFSTRTLKTQPIRQRLQNLPPFPGNTPISRQKTHFEPTIFPDPTFYPCEGRGPRGFFQTPYEDDAKNIASSPTHAIQKNALGR